MANEDVVIRIKSIADVSGVVNAITATDDLADVEKELTSVTKTVESAQGRASAALNHRAGRTQRLTDEERRLNTSTRAAIAASSQQTTTLAAQTAATNAAASATQNLTNQQNRMGRSARQSGQNMLQLAYFADDLQYGLRGIMNNIPGLIMALGGTAGLAGAISIAAVALGGFLPMLLNLGKDSEDVADKVDNSFKRTKDSVDDAAKAVEDYKSYLDQASESADSFADRIDHQSDVLKNQIEISEQLAIKSIELAKARVEASDVDDSAKVTEMARLDAIIATIKGINDVQEIERAITAELEKQRRIRQQTIDARAEASAAALQAQRAPSDADALRARAGGAGIEAGIGEVVKRMLEDVTADIAQATDESTIQPLEDLKTLLEGFGSIDIASEGPAFVRAISDMRSAIDDVSDSLRITFQRQLPGGAAGPTAPVFVTETTRARTADSLEKNLEAIQTAIEKQNAISDIMTAQEVAQKNLEESTKRLAEAQEAEAEALRESRQRTELLRDQLRGTQGINALDEATSGVQSAAAIEAARTKEENERLKAANEGIKAQFEGQQKLMSEFLGQLLTSAKQSPTAEGASFYHDLSKAMKGLSDGMDGSEQRELVRLVTQAARSSSETAALTARAIIDLNTRIRETQAAQAQIQTQLREGFR